MCIVIAIFFIGLFLFSMTLIIIKAINDTRIEEKEEQEYEEMWQARYREWDRRAEAEEAIAEALDKCRSCSSQYNLYYNY